MSRKSFFAKSQIVNILHSVDHTISVTTHPYSYNANAAIENIRTNWNDHVAIALYFTKLTLLWVVVISQIIRLHTLTLHNVFCQLYLNKAGRRKASLNLAPRAPFADPKFNTS